MSFPAYGSYKESGVEWLGQVPSHWAVCALGYRYEVALGKMLDEKRISGDYLGPYLRNTDVQWGKINVDDLPQMDFEDSEIQRYSLMSGDLLVCEGGEVGRAAIWKGDLARCFYQKALHRLRPYAAADDPSFFYYVLEAAAALGIFTAGGGKATIAHLPAESFRRHRFPFPGSTEQRAIAAFLDRETAKIDALVEAQRRLIELLKEKRQAVISHAVTKGLDPSAPMKDSGVEWLGQVPAHWEVTSLKRSWSVTDCKHVTAEFVDDGVQVASIREVQARFVDLQDAKQTTDEDYSQLIEGGRKPQAGDLIFSRNATVGEVAEVAEWHPPFAMGQDVCLLQRQSATSSSAYLYHVIKSQIVREQLALAMIGSTFKRVNVEEIRNLIVPIPRAEEQTRIAEFVEGFAAKADGLTREAEAAISLLQERRAALISAAVTGKIDVRGLVKTAEAA